MDAAPSLWRPLGEMLVDRGLLTPEELDEVLVLQKESDRKLGEIIVERGFVSGPTLAQTLAEQWGVELTSDEGFGTGLRNEIQRRHEGEQKRRPDLHAVPEPQLNGHEIFVPEAGDETLAELNAQLAEDDARIVQLEARLEQQLDARAGQEERIAELVAQEASRIEQALMNETAKLAERFALTQKDLLAAAADWRAKHEAQIVKLLADKLGRLEAGLKEGRPAALDAEDRQALEQGVAELVARELADARKQLLELVAKQRADEEVRLTKLLGEKLDALELSPLDPQPVDFSQHEARMEQRIAELVRHELSKFRSPAAQPVDFSQHEARMEKRIAEVVRHGLSKVPSPTAQPVDFSQHEARIEKRIAELVRHELKQLASPTPQIDLAEHEARIEKRIGELVKSELTESRKKLNEKIDALEIPSPATQVVDFSELEARLENQLTHLAGELRKHLSEKLDVLELPAPPSVDLSGQMDNISAAVAQQATRVEETLMKRSAKSDERLSERLASVQAALESLTQKDDDPHDTVGTDLRKAVKRLDRLEELVRTSTKELIERFEQPVVAQRGETEEVIDEEEQVPAFSEHLLFAPSEAGYSLMTVELPPPSIGAELALGDGERFVVTKVACSPFPSDERPCAYVQRVS